MIKNIVTNVIIPCIAVGGVCVAIYSSLIVDDRIDENKRITDSLRAEVNLYHQKYDSILLVSQLLDSAVTHQEEKVKIVKQTFIKYKTPPINHSDSAVKFLEEFIKE
jgi:hypothetical protein